MFCFGQGIIANLFCCMYLSCLSYRTQLLTDKILENNSDLFVSHDTWGRYEVMLKMLKHYKLKYHNITRISKLILFHFCGCWGDRSCQTTRMCMWRTTLGQNSSQCLES